MQTGDAPSPELFHAHTNDKSEVSFEEEDDEFDGCFVVDPITSA